MGPAERKSDEPQTVTLDQAFVAETDERRFLCDEMLVGLGRWLRIAGYDTAIANRGRSDRELVEQAHAEDRILLTRDRRLVEIRTADDRTLVLESEGIDAWAAELGRRLRLDWKHDPLSRCAVCNAVLEAAPVELRRKLPPRIRDLDEPVNACPRCGRLYWEGSHVRRIRRRLDKFAHVEQDPTPW